MIKKIIITKDSPFSVPGGILVSGDIDSYKIVIDMGTDVSDMTAMAICQENGEYSDEYECSGNTISLKLKNSIYKNPGYITVRVTVCQNNSVLTAKEIIFRVLEANNQNILAENESSTLSNILASVQSAQQAAIDAKEAAESAYSKDEIEKKADKSTTLSGYGIEDAYTKNEVDKKISEIEVTGGSADAYTKSETNALLNDKADKSNTYTKAEVENIHKDIVDDINTKLSSVFTYAGTGDAEIYYFIENGEWSGVVDIKHGLVFNITGNDGVDTPIIIPAQYSATGVERTLNKGDNVAVIDANYGISNTPDWKLDVLAGIENLDAYYTKTEINLKVSDIESEIQTLTNSDININQNINTLDARVDYLETFSNKMPIVSSVDEMTDTSMQYVLESTGTIWEYGETTIDDTDKNLFVKEEVALNQNPDGTTRDGYFSTGFIPADVNAVEDLKFLVTVNGAVLQDGYPLIYKIQHYKADLTTVGGQMYMNGFQSPNTSEWYLGTNQTGTDHNGALGTNYFQIAYFKLLIDVTDNSNVITMDDVPDLVITTNEPKVRVEAGWYDTGIVDEGGTVNLGDINSRINKNTNDIKNLDDRLEIVENAVNEGSDIPLIPDYWKAEVDSVKDKIKALQNEGGADAFQFIWVSDIHGSSDYTKHIGAVARYAMDKYNIPFFVCSGDILSQSSHTTESAVWDEYERMNTILSPIKPDEIFAVKGNHDGSWGEAVNGVYYLKNIGTKAVYNAVYSKGAKDRTKMYGKDGTYYYVDVHGMRVFMLNAHTDGDSSNDANGYANYNSQKVNVCGQEQLEWLCDSLSSMEEGMTAIIVAHPPLYNIEDRNLLIGIIEAFNNKTSYSGNVTVTNDYWGKNVSDTTYKNISVSVNFASAKGKILAYFHGHIHRDIDGNNPQYSIPHIPITTAGGDVRDANPEERVSGTATETAMDIVIVNKDKISLVRLGAGEDRDISTK